MGMFVRHRSALFKPRVYVLAPLVLVGLVVLGCSSPRASEAPSAEPPARPASVAAPVRIAAASDLTDAFGELGRSFEASSGQSVTFSFGSSGLLATQIRAGAPFDVFAAANASFVDGVVASGACDGRTKYRYGLGRVAIWSRAGRAAPPTSVAELADRRFGRIAIANPEHAPYGRAAKQALERAGVYDAVAPRIVLAENVRQALQFAETGNVDVAIVAWSLVVNDHTNPSTLVDAEMHAPIEQTLVVCDRGANTAGGRAFATYVASTEGRETMRRFGFIVPEAAAPP